MSTYNLMIDNNGQWTTRGVLKSEQPRWGYSWFLLINQLEMDENHSVRRLDAALKKYSH